MEKLTKQQGKADKSCMKSIPKRMFALAIIALFFLVTDVRAGLSELIETKSGGQLTLSIEGNALRLTDMAGGKGTLRVFSTAGSEATAAEDLGLAGEWPTLTILGASLQDDVIFPSTRLDSLLGGVGISTSGNLLKDISIIDSAGNGFSLDIDLVEVIGGPVPEPSTFIFTACGSVILLRWRALAV